MMVGASLLELGLLVSFNLSFIRLLRILRIARSLRMIHLLKFSGLRNLRLMLLAILGSAIPLLWAGLVLVFLMFFFGVIFLNGFADYTAEASMGDQNVVQLKLFFPDLPMTLLTLFMSITGGINWWEVQQLFLDMSLAYALVFVLFVLVTLLAAMNVITGIFVTDAVQMARLDSEMQVQQEMDENRHHLQNLRDLFQQMDAHDHGTITLEDFTTQMERQEVRMNFAMLGLDVSDAVAFFKLLDVDGSVELEIDEFVMGCMRFRGNRSNVNLECSVLEAKQLMVKSLTRQKRIQQKLSFIESVLENIWNTLEIKQGARGRRGPRRIYSDAISSPNFSDIEETVGSSVRFPKRAAPVAEMDETDFSQDRSSLTNEVSLDEPVIVPHRSPPSICL